MSQGAASAPACARSARSSLRAKWPKPDMAIYVEPTMLDVYVAHMGFFLCDIKVTGKTAYFGVPELGVDALKGRIRLSHALWRYSDELSAGWKHPLVGSGFILPTGIHGGGYIAVPGECRISASLPRFPPGPGSGICASGSRRGRAFSGDRSPNSRGIRISNLPGPSDWRSTFRGSTYEARLSRLVSAVRAFVPSGGISKRRLIGRTGFSLRLGSPEFTSRLGTFEFAIPRRKKADASGLLRRHSCSGGLSRRTGCKTLGSRIFRHAQS